MSNVNVGVLNAEGIMGHNPVSEHMIGPTPSRRALPTLPSIHYLPGRFLTRISLLIACLRLDISVDPVMLAGLAKKNETCLIANRLIES
jgi:hypothetical protein